MKKKLKKEDKQLDIVSPEQAQKLKQLGFDWPSEAHYSHGGMLFKGMKIKLEQTLKLDAALAPSVPLALKFLRKVYEISHNIYTRSYSEEQPWAFSVSHCYKSTHKEFKPLIIHYGDISKGADSDMDGVIFGYDLAESKALDYALDWLLEQKAKGNI
jgi:hypothetical protein